MMQRHWVERGIHVRRFQQRLAVGGKAESARRVAVVERLDAQPVAGQEQRALAQIPEGEGEHADQMLDALFAPFGIGFENDLGVALGEEAVTLGQQFPPQFPVVVDRAVEDQRQPQFRVHHGLIGAVAEIDDRQPAMTEEQRPVGPDAFVIGTAPGQSLQHPPHQGQIGFANVEAQFAANATHSVLSSRKLKEGSG
jgi:hypothetical protein